MSSIMFTKLSFGLSNADFSMSLYSHIYIFPQNIFFLKLFHICAHFAYILVLDLLSNLYIMLIGCLFLAKYLCMFHLILISQP